MSQNCFTQCDLPVLSHLAERFQVKWIIFFPRDDNHGYSESELREYAKSNGVDLTIVRLSERLRSLANIPFFWKLLAPLRKWNPDLVYVNATGHPWLGPTILGSFGRRKVLWAIHDAVEHGSNGVYRLYALYKVLLLTTFRLFHALSENQAQLIRKRAPGSTVLVAPHPPLNSGETRQSPPIDRTRFLFFGIIEPYKGVDLLIEAAQLAAERCDRRMEFVIAGFTEEWERYADLIRREDLFRIDIRSIPNKEIPDLFGSSHWLLLPYRHVTQSGPLALALHYGLPSITTDLPGFTDFLEAGSTAIQFPVDDVEEFSKILVRAGRMEAGEYRDFRRNTEEFARKHLSMEDTRRRYERLWWDALANAGYHNSSSRTSP
ncbi:MAG: glycosyltransferase family 4 protein [Fibrobacteria bacterium]|nr:glycosyltransferase family 4 protein [Fibrobacteria bacterium]